MISHDVPTNLNPADILSRGTSPEELAASKLWKNGPDFLKNDATKWPKLLDFLTDLPERKRVVLITTPANDWSATCKYHNTFARMQRIFAYVYKFVIIKFALNNTIKLGALTPLDLKMGTYLLIRNVQQIHFATEYKILKANKSILSSSKLCSLTPLIRQI